MKFQVPYISMYVCAENLRLNYFQGLGNILLSQRYELSHEAAFHKGQLFGLSILSLAPSFVQHKYKCSISVYYVPYVMV
jgi:hypothetical protein